MKNIIIWAIIALAFVAVLYQIEYRSIMSMIFPGEGESLPILAYGIIFVALVISGIFKDFLFKYKFRQTIKEI